MNKESRDPRNRKKNKEPKASDRDNQGTGKPDTDGTNKTEHPESAGTG